MSGRAGFVGARDSANTARYSRTTARVVDASEKGRLMKAPRDVLADKVFTGTDEPYQWADKVINKLDSAGWDVMPHQCLRDGCTEELGAHCDHHGYVVWGHPFIEKMNYPEGASFVEDIAAVLSVYDEHVAPEDRGPWRDRLAHFCELDAMEETRA